MLLIAAAGGISLVERPDISDIEPSPTKMISYTLLALVVFVIAGVGVSALPQSLTVLKNLSTTDQGVFGALMAISEEFFFRGFVTGWLYQRQGYIFSIFGSSAVFTAYHLLVYGVSANLIYVFVAGVVLAYVFLKTGSLVPDTLAHIINNLVATGVI